MERIRFGLVGRRTGSFMAALQAAPEAEVTAYCDIDDRIRDEVADRYGIPGRYASFAALLEADVDAVVIGTPMPFHAPQAIAALEAGKHVLSEVPAAVSLEECEALVRTVRRTGGIYMMAENYTYIRANVLVGELVKQGLFGEVYFGVGEYIHELKDLNEKTPWRRVWQTGRNGNTYPTHSVGPVLQWMNDRVVSVVCMGSGHHYRDPRGAAYENEDTTTTLCRLAGGGMVQLRLDMLSNRPHKMDYYQLQGTKGCYEAARAPGETNKIWLADHASGPNAWRPLSDFEDALPALWRNPPPEALAAGHGGGDYWEVRDFIEAVLQNRPPRIDVVTAAEWTAVGLCSIESIERGSVPVEVPDFRGLDSAG